MKKLFTISSIVLSGLILGSLAGKTSTTENSLKIKRNNLSKSPKGVRKYFNKSNDDDELDQYFI